MPCQPQRYNSRKGHPQRKTNNHKGQLQQPGPIVITVYDVNLRKLTRNISCENTQISLYSYEFKSVNFSKLCPAFKEKAASVPSSGPRIIKDILGQYFNFTCVNSKLM
jgi:hypothetical protein